MKLTGVGTVFAPLILCTLLSSFGVAMLSLMSIGQHGDQKAPLYLYLMLVTSFIHMSVMLIGIDLVVRLKRFVKPKTLEGLDGKLGEAFLFIMVCLWWAAVIAAFLSEPTCDVDSDWYNAIAALHSKAPMKKVVQYCQGSLIGLGLSTLNAIFLLVAAVVSLFFPFSRTQPQPILGRLFGLHRPAPPPSELSTPLEPSRSEKTAPQQTKAALDMSKYGLPIFGHCIPLVMVQLVLLVLLLYPPTPVKQPQWWSTTFLAAMFHLLGHTWVQIILGVLNAALSERRMAQIQPWVVRAYVAVIVCLWLAGTARIFQAHPSCAAGSDWVMSLVPNSSEIDNERTPEQVALGRCPTTMALVVFTVIITIFLTGSALVGSGLGSLLRSMGRRRRSRPQEEAEVDVVSSVPLLQDEVY